MMRVIMSHNLMRKLCAGCGGTGCDGCGQVGYSGRGVVSELLRLDGALSDLISRGISGRELADHAVNSGF